jgi:hypothetical protein
MKTIIKKALGVILIIVGLFALFTPLTPGSWLALIGLELLGVHLLFFKKFLTAKQRAALERFMKRLGFESSAKRGDDKSDTKEK